MPPPRIDIRLELACAPTANTIYAKNKSYTIKKENQCAQEEHTGQCYVNVDISRDSSPTLTSHPCGQLSILYSPSSSFSHCSPVFVHTL